MRLFAQETPDQVVVVPAGMDDDTARPRLPAVAGHAGVPVPDLVPVDLRVGLFRVLVRVVDHLQPGGSLAGVGTSALTADENIERYRGGAIFSTL